MAVVLMAVGFAAPRAGCSLALPTPAVLLAVRCVARAEVHTACRWQPGLTPGGAWPGLRSTRHVGGGPG